MSTLTIAERVRQIDETRLTESFRNPDRPDGRTFRKRPRQPIEITRAKTRSRTAAWRVRQDSKRAPSTNQIGMALVLALATSDIAKLTGGELTMITRALADLERRGFDMDEARKALRRIGQQARTNGRRIDGGDTEFSVPESRGR